MRWIPIWALLAGCVSPLPPSGVLHLAFDVPADGTSVRLIDGSATAGLEQLVTVTLSAEGTETVHVASIDLESADPAFSLVHVSVHGLWYEPVGGEPITDLTLSPDGPPIHAVVRFLGNHDGKTRYARLLIVTDAAGPTEATFRAVPALVSARVEPHELDFDGPGVKEVTVTSTGVEPLLLSGATLTADVGFQLVTDFSSPVRVEPGASTTIQVAFGADGGPAVVGQLLLSTNVSEPPPPTVTLKAHQSGACITVAPTQLEFGGTLVGHEALLPLEIGSCGGKSLVVSAITLAPGSDPAFTLESLPDLVLVLAPGETAKVEVRYAPTHLGAHGADGGLVFDTGTLVIASNAWEDLVEVPLSGVGVDAYCPTPVMVVLEGEKVIPQTNLHLYGDQSFASSGGAIASWKWTVKQPTGAASVFVPSDTFPNPTFEVNTAGVYAFRLDVWDLAGVQSCVPAEVEVVVVPDEAIHVELLWHTPNDPDETDQGPAAGADMDLHFVHDAYAASGPDLDKDGKPDPWFDQPFDCFWFNAHPNWGSFEPSIDDDPGMDRDDTDGAGPENLNLNIPENTTYRIGVHYWNDHEYGPAYLTLRVYIYSVLVYEVSDVKLVNHDLWNAATITWPNALVTPVLKSGERWITPAYQNPFFFQP